MDEIAKREARERLKREQLTADLVAVLSDPAGRRVMEHIVYELGALEVLSYAPDSRQHAFNEGQRAVGLTLNRELEQASVELWVKMRDERNTRIRLEPRDPQPNKTDQ